MSLPHRTQRRGRRGTGRGGEMHHERQVVEHGRWGVPPRFMLTMGIPRGEGMAREAVGVLLMEKQREWHCRYQCSRRNSSLRRPSGTSQPLLRGAGHCRALLPRPGSALLGSMVTFTCSFTVTSNLQKLSPLCLALARQWIRRPRVSGLRYWHSSLKPRMPSGQRRHHASTSNLSDQPAKRRKTEEVDLQEKDADEAPKQGLHPYRNCLRCISC